MEELYKQVAAKFLVDSKFHTQVEVTHEALNNSYIPKESMVEYLNRELIERLTGEMGKRYEKEIKTENTQIGEKRTLELYVFPKTQFKLMIEFIVSQMPESEIARIRETK